jgi:hypothetical protein
VPSRNSAHVCKFPAATCATSPIECTGMTDCSVDPSPSSPALLSPQHQTSVLSLPPINEGESTRAHVCEAPALIAITVLGLAGRFCTITGADRSVVVPSPS